MPKHSPAKRSLNHARKSRDTAVKILPLESLAASAGLDIPAIDNSISDILVVEFDRALLYGPIPNLDLMDTASSRILESKLGASNWWESPAVLEVAGKYCGWNESLLATLRAAIASHAVFTVVVTGRTQTSEQTIRKLMIKKQFEGVDMLVFSDPGKPVLSRKQALVQVLWRHFGNAERMAVFEGRPRDANVMSATLESLAASPYARGVEGFYFQEVIGPLALLPPIVERRLITQLVAYGPEHLRSSIATGRWSHQLVPDSLKTLLEWTSQLSETLPSLNNTSIYNFLASRILIISGDLPVNLRTRAAKNTSVVWKIMGISVQGLSLIGYAQPIQFDVAPIAENMGDRGAPIELAKIKSKEPGERTFLPYEPVAGPTITTVIEETRLLKLRLA